MKSIFLSLLVTLSPLAQAKTVFYCTSSLESPAGPSSIAIKEENGKHSLIYRENNAAPLKTLSSSLSCYFSRTSQLPFVTFCQNDQDFLNVRQSTEAQLYGESGVMKFGFVTFTLRSGLGSFEFKTRVEMCHQDQE